MSTQEQPQAESLHEIRTLEDLRVFAHDLIARLGSRQILLLNGPMGAGKTQFTRFLVEELGGDETASPSFAIHNQYQTERGSVEHLDLFRLENEDELESTGFWDLFSNPEGLIVIEWAERLPVGSLPRTWATLELTFEPRADGRRLIREWRLR